MASAIVPAIYDPTVADDEHRNWHRRSLPLLKRLAREEGMLVSPSAAAALAGCLQWRLLAA